MHSGPPRSDRTGEVRKGHPTRARRLDINVRARESAPTDMQTAFSGARHALCVAVYGVMPTIMLVGEAVGLDDLLVLARHGV